jgi:hypothetical protein
LDDTVLKLKQGLGTMFREYFPAMSDDNNWIYNPLESSASDTLNTEEKAQ